jgi:hypothetical protein
MLGSGPASDRPILPLLGEAAFDHVHAHPFAGMAENALL